jgi:hypothetical protein
MPQILYHFGTVELLAFDLRFKRLKDGEVDLRQEGWLA